jgi:hypothetical protein
MFRPLKIRFELDGTGMYYDPMEPPMLDGILTAASIRWHVHGEPPMRDEVPDVVPLPLKKWQMGEHWGWCASALFPGEETMHSLTHWRKRFRHHREHLTTGSPNTKNGIYRDWNMPLPLLLTRSLVGFAFGESGKIRRELRRSVKYIGKKRGHGYGRVVAVEVVESEDDYSLVRYGKATRYLPDPAGDRMVRLVPPYWNNCDRVACCEIGEPAPEFFLDLCERFAKV